MRRYVLLCFACILSTALAAGGKHIQSRAGFSIVHANEVGAASVGMDITGSTGWFQYAAEDHEETLLCTMTPTAAYPHVIVKSTKILNTKFMGKRFTMHAEGLLQGEPVVIDVTAYDGGKNGKNDTFEIICKDPNGALVYQRGSAIETGDISIN